MIECLPIIHKTLSPIPSNRKSQNTAIKLILNCYRSQFLVHTFPRIVTRGKKLRGNKKCRIEAKPKEMVSISISKLYLICQLHDIHVGIPVCVYVHVYLSIYIYRYRYIWQWLMFEGIGNLIFWCLLIFTSY